MNQMPTDWLEQLKREYPKRSGPMRWPRVFLPVRRALLETSWESIMEGVKRYATYCEQSGKQGSDFVAAPENFFKDEIYLEELEFKPIEDPKIGEARRLEGERMRGAIDRAIQAGATSRPYPQESAAAFETRIRLEENSGPRFERAGKRGHLLGNDLLADRMSDLTKRLRSVK